MKARRAWVVALWPPSLGPWFVAFDALVIRGVLFLGVAWMARWFPGESRALPAVTGAVWFFDILLWLVFRSRAPRVLDLLPSVHALAWCALAARTGVGQSLFLLGFFVEIGLSALRASAVGAAAATAVSTASLAVLASLDATDTGSRTAAVTSGCVLLTGAVFSLLARQLGRALVENSAGTQVAVAAHRIKNSLTAAAGFAELLDADPTADDAQRTLALKVRTGIAEAHQRLEDLMAPPGRNHDSPAGTRSAPAASSLGDSTAVGEHVELRAAAERAVDACRALLDRSGVHCTVEVPTGVEARIAPAALHHVLLDLIQNAVEAMGPAGGGALRILMKRRRCTALVVRDNGPGIPRALRRRWLSPWSPHRPGGHGLGLASARRLLHAYGASLRLGKAPDGHGAEVEIRLRSSSLRFVGDARR